VPQASVRVYWPRHVSTDVAVLKRRLDEPQIVFKFGLISYQKPRMSCRSAKTSVGTSGGCQNTGNFNGGYQGQFFDSQQPDYGQQCQGVGMTENHQQRSFQPGGAYGTGTCVTTCASCGAPVMTSAGLGTDMIEGAIGMCSGLAAVGVTRMGGQYLRDHHGAPSWLPGAGKRA
jgi:hypothetical protein